MTALLLSASGLIVLAILFIAGVMGRLRVVFVVMASALLVLTGIAAVRDSGNRDYLAIQDQYKKDYTSSSFDSKVQQLFPSFAESRQGDTFRVERCISCHVPDIAEVGPDVAAQRLAADFNKYEPNAAQIAKTNGLTGVHPVSISAQYYCAWGQTGNGYTVQRPSAAPAPATAAATPSSSPAAAASSSPVATPAATASSSPAATPSEAAAPSGAALPSAAAATPSPSPGAAALAPDCAAPAAANGAASGSTASAKSGGTKIAGFLPAFLAPSANGGTPLGIDQVGCIVCHNGQRLELDEQHGHLNLIINPQYDFTQGAQLYYTYCVSCHGVVGEGGIGPPLSNQDRLGFFNEDYYYRCIEFGNTGFEHIGSKMPAWVAIAPDYSGDVSKLPKPPLTPADADVLTQFIRHWENYSTLP